jgi:transcriptional regulator with XRE-family HTH domain
VLNALITSNQIRAARTLIRWTAQDLADSSGVAISTIKRMEVMEGVPSGNIKTLSAIQAALEGAGIEFIGSPNDSPGVRLRTQK